MPKLGGRPDELWIFMEKLENDGFACTGSELLKKQASRLQGSTTFCAGRPAYLPTTKIWMHFAAEVRT